MTIIDCHTHLGRNEYITSNVKDLLISMDEAGIDKTLVFAGTLNDCPNGYMFEQISPHKDRLLGVAAANELSNPNPFSANELSNPFAADLKHEARQIAEWYESGKIVACKFYTGYHHHLAGSESVRYYLEELNRVGCPAIFHCGGLYDLIEFGKLKYCHPFNIDDVAVDYRNINFVIAHVGSPFHREAAEVCYKNRNVYADISGFVYQSFNDQSIVRFNKMIDEVLEITLSDERLLFGTDWPIASQKSYVDTIPMTKLSMEVLSENAKRAFKL